MHMAATRRLIGSFSSLPFRRPRRACAAPLGAAWFFLAALASAAEPQGRQAPARVSTFRIVIDGAIADWEAVPGYADPPEDSHDVQHDQPGDSPAPVDHPDVDLLEFKVAHDTENLFLFWRSRGQIGRTAKATDAPPRGKADGTGTAGDERGGRFYAIVAIDVDGRDDTGYWLHEGGYYPTSNGYDVNAEIEFFAGQFNTACYMNHGARDAAELEQAFQEQSAGTYRQGRDGPYKPGFVRLLPGTYKRYTQWVFHENGTITFVRDRGPVVNGVAKAAVSEDGHCLEAAFPYRGFLKDETGRPILGLGRKIDLSFSLEASGEHSPDSQWASDTAEPVLKYWLKPPGPAALSIGQ